MGFGRLRGVLALFLLVPFGSSVYPQTPPSRDKPQETVEVSSPKRIRLGGFVAGLGYLRSSGYYRPYYLPWYYDPWYFTLFASYWGPYPLHPGWYSGFAYRRGMGEIKLKTNEPTAQVLLDGALAGEARDLKSIWLEPGAYNLTVRAQARTPFEMRVYVLSGKTLKISADLSPAQESPP